MTTKAGEVTVQDDLAAALVVAGIALPDTQTAAAILAALPDRSNPEKLAERLRLAEAVLKAARLLRNSMAYGDGEWVAIPRADLDALRAALDAYREAKHGV